jgi:hypothetical protein
MIKDNKICYRKAFMFRGYFINLIIDRKLRKVVDFEAYLNYIVSNPKTPEQIRQSLLENQRFLDRYELEKKKTEDDIDDIIDDILEEIREGDEIALTIQN